LQENDVRLQIFPTFWQNFKKFQAMFDDLYTLTKSKNTEVSLPPA
jgi:hypothetical protein